MEKVVTKDGLLKDIDQRYFMLQGAMDGLETGSAAYSDEAKVLMAIVDGELAWLKTLHADLSKLFG